MSTTISTAVFLGGSAALALASLERRIAWHHPNYSSIARACLLLSLAALLHPTPIASRINDAGEKYLDITGVSFILQHLFQPAAMLYIGLHLALCAGLAKEHIPKFVNTLTLLLAVQLSLAFVGNALETPDAGVLLAYKATYLVAISGCAMTVVVFGAWLLAHPGNIRERIVCTLYASGGVITLISIGMRVAVGFSEAADNAFLRGAHIFSLYGVALAAHITWRAARNKKRGGGGRFRRNRTRAVMF